MTQIVLCAIRELCLTQTLDDVQTLTARQQEQQRREQVAALQFSLENQRVDLQDITSNMQRQYKVFGQDAMLALMVENCCRASARNLQQPGAGFASLL